MSTNMQPIISNPNPINLTVDIDQSPGIFSGIARNLKNASRIERIFIIAVSILMTAAVLVALPKVFTGAILLHKIGVVTLVPPFFMYYFSDFLKAVREFTGTRQGSSQ